VRPGRKRSLGLSHRGPPGSPLVRRAGSWERRHGQAKARTEGRASRALRHVAAEVVRSTPAPARPVNGYLVLVDGTRYVVQAETNADAEHRARDALGQAGERAEAIRRLTEAELMVLQLRLGEVRLEPAEHG
jgi:hypothetical protein